MQPKSTVTGFYSFISSIVGFFDEIVSLFPISVSKTFDSDGALGCDSAWLYAGPSSEPSVLALGATPSAGRFSSRTPRPRFCRGIVDQLKYIEANAKSLPTISIN